MEMAMGGRESKGVAMLAGTSWSTQDSLAAKDHMESKAVGEGFFEPAL